MADSTDPQQEKAPPALDLSSLNSLSLGPDWGSGKPQKQKSAFRDYGERDERRGRGRRFDGDDRGGGGTGGGGGDRRGRPDRRGNVTPRRGREFGEQREERDRGPFQPVVEVDFYPEEEPFRVLSEAIRKSCRTFELFEIARLILDKPERFVCVLKDPQQKDGEPARLFACVVDGLPFRSEEEVLNHVFQHYLGEFFTMEEVEGEAPAGSFPMVHKCGITGEVIGPPNYHRYKTLCREHHAARLGDMPYERFEQKLESSREEEDIKAWQEKMRKQVRYTVKSDPEKVFNTMEDARLYLLTNARDQLVRPAYSARFSGKALQLLPAGDMIRRSVEYLLEGQRRFPLDTANHLRGRLRRMKFAVYKRGSKGVSYICGVKRKFRTPGQVFAENLQELIDFLEAHPEFPAKDLPKVYLGIDPEKQADGAAAAEPPLALRQLKTDLRYLVSEGYVIEYSDGRLMVPAVQEPPAKEASVAKQKPEPAPEPQPEPAPEPQPEPAPEPQPEPKLEPTPDPTKS